MTSGLKQLKVMCNSPVPLLLCLGTHEGGLEKARPKDQSPELQSHHMGDKYLYKSSRIHSGLCLNKK